MARVNISIPEDLRESMVGLNCNWSALAQEAFAHAVELERLRGEGQSMEAGLARLRADKHRHSQREQAEGFQHGMAWALDAASYDELKEAGSLDPAKPPDAVQWVNRKLDKARPDLPDMPNSNVGASYALGFLQAASEVLSKV